MCHVGILILHVRYIDLYIIAAAPRFQFVDDIRDQCFDIWLGNVVGDGPCRLGVTLGASGNQIGARCEADAAGARGQNAVEGIGGMCLYGDTGDFGIDYLI